MRQRIRPIDPQHSCTAEGGQNGCAQQRELTRVRSDDAPPLETDPKQRWTQGLSGVMLSVVLFDYGTPHFYV